MYLLLNSKSDFNIITDWITAVSSHWVAIYFLKKTEIDDTRLFFTICLSHLVWPITFIPQLPQVIKTTSTGPMPLSILRTCPAQSLPVCRNFRSSGARPLAQELYGGKRQIICYVNAGRSDNCFDSNCSSQIRSLGCFLKVISFDISSSIHLKLMLNSSK